MANLYAAIQYYIGRLLLLITLFMYVQQDYVFGCICLCIFM